MDDLDILLPDQTVTIDGQPVTVRELRFAETLRIGPVMAPIIDMLIDADIDGEEVMRPELFDAALCAHADAWISFIALACRRSPEWVETLSDTDGRLLQMAAVERNRSFFVQRLLLAVELRKRAAASSTGSTPSPDGTAPTRPSSPSDSLSDRSSASTPQSAGAAIISGPT